MNDETVQIPTGADRLTKGLEPMKDTPISTPVGIAAIALNMAIQYHDAATIKDGVMYQAYKMEGRNLRTINIDMVFETAIKIEMHLLGASDRIAKALVEAIQIAVDEDEEPQAGTEVP